MATSSDNTLEILQSSLSTGSTVGSDHLYLRPGRALQKFHLIWLHEENLDESNQDYCNNISQLECIVNSINRFTDIDECIDYLSELETVFFIISGALSEQIVPLIHDVSQLQSIYIFCNNQSTDEAWIKHWRKIKGIYTDITQIYDALKQTITQYDRDFISVSFISTNAELSQNLDLLDQSFMYTQILKESILEVNYNEQAVKDFANYCREGNYGELNAIDTFEREYHNHAPIWWYSREPFLHTMLNRALRIFETDIIIKMGFFISCLHRNIEQLHQEEYGQRKLSPFTVYRGQGISKEDSEKLIKAKGGLISFNNFLSTSYDRKVSDTFAVSNRNNPNLVGVLFVINIDPSISSTPFAYVIDVSNFTNEQELLFSMHTVFRIHEIKQIDRNNLFEVVLKLLPAYHPAFISYYYNLGDLYDKMGDSSKALLCEEKALEFLERSSPSNHPSRLTLYSNAAWIYITKGNYPKAISFCQKAFEIYYRTNCPNRLGLVQIYKVLAYAFTDIKVYSAAVEVYKEILAIQEKNPPQNRSEIAYTSSQIAEVYENTGAYWDALSFYRKTLCILKKIRSPDRSLLATCYNNIASVYYKMGKYSKAVSLYEKSVEISEKTFPLNHLNIAASYNNIGSVHSKMGDYRKAQSSYENALNILESSASPDQSSILRLREHIEILKTTIGAD